MGKNDKDLKDLGEYLTGCIELSFIRKGEYPPFGVRLRVDSAMQRYGDKLDEIKCKKNKN